MFRTIVVGYDGPGRGDDAIALAELLRDRRDGILVLTEAYPPAAVAAGPFVAAADFSRLTDQALDTVRAELERHVPVRTISRPGAPARVLTEAAEREDADLVVIGSTRHGAVGRVLLGTTAERLLHGAPCAVAVAPRGFASGELRHLGAAYDGSPEADAALDAAEALARECGAALTVYCVVEPAHPTDSMIAAGTGEPFPSVVANEQAKQLLRAVDAHAPAGLKLDTLRLHGHAAKEILDRAAGVVDLLFVGSRGYGPLRRALLGSVSGDIARDGRVPVVVLPRTAVGALRTSTRHTEAAQA
jgi:nucleotide-binding universal stress UspA family protein